MSAFLRLAACFAAGGLGGLRRFLDGNQTQAQSGAMLSANPDRPIDQAALRGIAQRGNQIERVAVAVEPAGALPSRPHQHIGPGLDHRGDALGLHVGPVGDANLALLDRYPVQPLAAMLVSQRKEPEAFGGKLKTAVDAPQSVLLPGRQTGPRPGGPIAPPTHAPPTPP